MEDQEYSGQDRSKSIKGYQIVIVILALILAALSYMYYHQTSEMRGDFAAQRDTLQNNLTSLMSDMDNIRTANDTITQSLGVERGRADSLLQSLQKERNLSSAKIHQYERELGTLRTVMRGFVQQIDSLNKINNRLITENTGMHTQIAQVTLERDKNAEQVNELETKVRKAAVIMARGINLLALNASDKEVTRASRAARLRVDLVLPANATATPGQRNVYARITGPDGYPMAVSGGGTFVVDAQRIPYSAVREVDYQGADLPVSLYYTGGGITEGKYRVEIFMDGLAAGSNEIILK